MRWDGKLWQVVICGRHDEEPYPPLGCSVIRSIQYIYTSGVADIRESCQEVVESPAGPAIRADGSQQASNVLHENESWSKLRGNAEIVVNDLASWIFKTSLQTGRRPWLARRTARQEVRAPILGDSSGTDICDLQVRDVVACYPRASQIRAISLDRDLALLVRLKRLDTVTVEV